MPIQKKSKDPREKEKKRIERLQEKVTPPEDTVKRFAVLIGGALVAFIVLLGTLLFRSCKKVMRESNGHCPLNFHRDDGEPTHDNPRGTCGIMIGLHKS